ncbi:uncharacterized protein [Amphiura filiformis]|uniref:uncharacterized protein n=1 Tax=Amphiura filiformis TaxID=82378 RepID=UPI003B20DCF4
MAAAYLENAEAGLSCPLCLELFVDPNTPKQLDCPHVYCQKCLTKMVKGGLRVITCPECRRETRVPRKTPVNEGGVSALRTSIRLRSLAENHLKHPEKLKAYESAHTESSVPTCEVHDDEKLHFYCVTCRVLVCQACGFLDHDKSTHEIKGVKTIYAEKLQQMKDRIQSANIEKKKNKHLVQQVLKLKKQVKESTAETEQEIDRAKDDAVAKVIESGKTIKTQLRELRQKHLLGYQKQEEELDRDNQALGKVIAEAGRVMESATPYEYVTKHDQLEEKFEEIQLGGKSTKEVRATTSYKFVSEQFGDLGKLVPVRKMKQTQTIDFRNYMSTCTSIYGGNDVLAVCQRNSVQIYHKQATDKYKHELNLDVKDAHAVAVTDNGKYMVATSTSIEVFGPKGQHEGTFNKRDPPTAWDTDGLSSIAVLCDGRIIVGSDDTKTLVVLTHDGRKLKTINLNFEPFSLTAMNGSQVALCDLLNKVYVWDVDSGREVISVDIPDVRCVCYDVSDCLLIGSGLIEVRGSGKIEQYCVNPCKFIASFNTGSDIPIAMTFSDTNHLVVGFKSETSYLAEDYIKIYNCTG